MESVRSLGGLPSPSLKEDAQEDLSYALKSIQKNKPAPRRLG
jgi:hypothetical protein